MPQDINPLLMNLLEILSKATGLIAAHLRGNAPASYAPAPSVEEVAVPEPVPAATSALDRIQDYEPAPAAVAEEADTPKKRGRRGKLNISEADLKKMYVADGLTAKQIAAKFGVAPGTVAQRVMKLGLSKRGPSPMKGRKRAK
jgi:hypothetical protein